MAKRTMPSLENWEAEKSKDEKFTTAAKEQEAGYQVARLRILRGLTQAELAEQVGTQQPSIARLENGSHSPSLSFLNKIAKALNARIELNFVIDNKLTAHQLNEEVDEQASYQA